HGRWRADQQRGECWRARGPSLAGGGAPWGRGRPGPTGRRRARATQHRERRGIAARRKRNQRTTPLAARALATSLDPDSTRDIQPLSRFAPLLPLVTEGPVMSTPHRTPAAGRFLPEWLCPWLALALVLAAAALHLLYLANDCPLDLAPDEAHYWDWSRNIDWSYYSKGPLVAWLIRASCELIGPWSEEATGSLMFAVRLPAVVCGSLLLVSLYVLTVQV